MSSPWRARVSRSDRSTHGTVHGCGLCASVCGAQQSSTCAISSDVGAAMTKRVDPFQVVNELGRDTIQFQGRYVAQPSTKEALNLCALLNSAYWMGKS